MRLLAFLLLLASCCVFSAYCSEEWYLCSNSPEMFDLSMNASHIEVRNATIYLYPRNLHTGEILTASYISLEMRGIQEWYTPLPRVCHEPSEPFPPGSMDDPSTAMTLFMSGQMNCSTTKLNTTLPNGYTRAETITIRARHIDFPGFEITTNITKSYGTYEQRYIGNPTTNFTDYYIRYFTDSYKVSLSIENFPWQDTTNHSHLVLYLTGHGQMDRVGHIAYGQQTAFTRFDYNSTDNSLAFREDLDRGFLLDGVAYMNGQDHGSEVFPYVPANYTTNINFAFGFCQIYSPDIHPADIQWDPQLSVLFNAPPEETPTSTPGAPTTAPARFSKNYTPIAVGVSVGAAALIGIFIVVYIFSPKLQAVFQPFKQADRTAHQEAAVNARWSAAVRSPAVTRTTD